MQMQRQVLCGIRRIRNNFYADRVSRRMECSR